MTWWASVWRGMLTKAWPSSVLRGVATLAEASRASTCQARELARAVMLQPEWRGGGGERVFENAKWWGAWEIEAKNKCDGGCRWLALRAVVVSSFLCKRFSGW